MNSEGLKYLFIAAAVVGAPLILQSLMDIFGGPVLVPFLLLAVLLTLEIGIGVALLGSLIDSLAIGRLRPTEVTVFAAMLAWVASVTLWVATGASAGGAFGGISAALVLSAYTFHFIGSAVTEGSRADAGPGDGGPDFARIRMDDGKFADVRIDQVGRGDLFVVADGGVSPLDGVISEGIAEFTGGIANTDLMPRTKGPGDIVYRGEKCYGDSVSIHMAWDPGQGISERTSRLTQRADVIHDDLDAPKIWLFAYFIFIFLTGLVALGVWTNVRGIGAGILAAGGIWSLGIPIPLALAKCLPLVSMQRPLATVNVKFTAPARLLQLGMPGRLVISAESFIMTGRVGLVQIVALGQEDEDQILSLLSAAFALSGHPLGEATSTALERRSLQPKHLFRASWEAARGISCQSEDKGYLIGNPSLLASNNVSYRHHDDTARALEEKGLTVVWIAEVEPNRELLALAAFAPMRRPQDIAGDMADERVLDVEFLLPPLPPATLRAIDLDQSMRLRSIRSPEEAVGYGNELLEVPGGYALALGGIWGRAYVNNARLILTTAEAPSAVRARADVIIAKPDAHASIQLVERISGLGREVIRNFWVAFSTAGFGVMLALAGIGSIPLFALISLFGLAGVLALTFRETVPKFWVKK